MKARLEESDGLATSVMLALWQDPLEDQLGLGRGICSQEAYIGTHIHAVAALAATRLWIQDHGSPPAKLQQACEAAGLGSVPTDGFTGQPVAIRTFTQTWGEVNYSFREDDQPQRYLAGETIIYSHGPDGDDDAGMTVWSIQNGLKGDGDWVFAVSKSQ